MTIIYFIIALGLLVLVHEWGHFIVAKKSGIRVEQFSIGFGPKIFGFTHNGTEFKISPIPLGGYVKLFGEDPVAEADGDVDKAKEIAAAPDAFSSRPMRFRLATVMAGPAMNILLCLILMPLVFLIGRQVPAIMEAKPVILGIVADSPAEQVGLKKGDEILSIDGNAMQTWTDVLHQIIIRPNTTVQLEVQSGSEKKMIPLGLITPPLNEQMMGYAGFEPQYFWQNEPIVGQVTPHSPALKAELKSEDRIVSIDGEALQTWDDLTRLVRGSNGTPLKMEIKSGDSKRTVTVTPEYNDAAKAYVLGITKYTDPNTFVKKKYPIGQAIQMGWLEVAKLFNMTLDVLGRLFQFDLSYKALGGPLQIAQASGQAARAGFSEFLYFLSFLSLQLGVLNLLPIPVLDGGHVLFMTIEKIRGKPLPLKLKNSLVSGGMILLLGLMILITINDVDRMWNFSEMWQKIRGLF